MAASSSSSGLRHPTSRPPADWARPDAPPRSALPVSRQKAQPRSWAPTSAPSPEPAGVPWRALGRLPELHLQRRAGAAHVALHVVGRGGVRVLHGVLVPLALFLQRDAVHAGAAEVDRGQQRCKLRTVRSSSRT
ncbi:hypothetical protein BS78_08G095100 [Paspalum vaginatum]|nr:hypothetical protein BS78_08G095100 [Paspalum vaginatum]